MKVYEYGCNECRSTFKKPQLANRRVDKTERCPRCGSNRTEKLESSADKLRFFTRFAWGGG